MDHDAMINQLLSDINDQTKLLIILKSAVSQSIPGLTDDQLTALLTLLGETP